MLAISAKSGIFNIVWYAYLAAQMCEGNVKGLPPARGHFFKAAPSASDCFFTFNH